MGPLPRPHRLVWCARKRSSMSWPRRTNSTFRTSLWHFLKSGNSFGICAAIAARYWPILSQLTVTLLWEFPAFFSHDLCHFYSGVWIGSWCGKGQCCSDGVGFLLSYVLGYGLKWYLRISMGEISFRLLSLRLELLLNFTHYTSYVTVCILLLVNSST